MKALFDTNVILDVLLARSPHAEIAAQLMNLVDRGRLKGLLCATTVTTIHYLATKASGPHKANESIRNLLAIFEVAPVNHSVLFEAQKLGYPDYEDAVLHEAARMAGAKCIVTRNIKDFAKSKLPVFEPQQFLSAILTMES